MLRFLSLIVLLTVLFALNSCVRNEVEHDGVGTPYEEIDENLVDSLFAQLSVLEKLELLLINAPEVIEDSLVITGGVNITGTNYSNFKFPFSDSTSAFPHFVLSEEPNFVTNNFEDLTEYPSALALHSSTLESPLKNHWIQSAKLAHDLGVNIIINSPIQEPDESNASNFQHLNTPEKDKLIKQSIAQMNTWQEQGHLSFVGPLNRNIYNPEDTLIRKSLSWSCLFSLIQNGAAGIEVDPNLIQRDSNLFIKPSEISNFVQDEFQYNGLLLSRVSNLDELERCFYGGVDLFVSNIDKSEIINFLTKITTESFLLKQLLDQKARKVLKAKIWMGYDEPIAEEAMEKARANISNLQHDTVVSNILMESITLVNNPGDLIPLEKTNSRFRIIELGASQEISFGKEIEFYADAGTKFFGIRDGEINGKIDPDKFNGRPIIMLINDQNLSSLPAVLRAINEILEKRPAVVVNVNQPQNISLLDTTAAIFQIYGSERQVLQKTVQAIFGGDFAQGSFPLNFANSGKGIEKYKALSTENELPFRIRKGQPEEVGVHAYSLVQLDVLAKKAIEKGAFPGCQMTIVKDGVIIYDKVFGHLDSAGIEVVKSEHLYDVASLTKIAGTALMAMKLYDEKKFKLNDRLSKHLKWTKTTAIKSIKLKDLLTHRSGLQPNLPIVKVVFPKEEREDCNPYTCNDKVGPYQIKVAKDMYYNINSLDSMWQEVGTLSSRRRKFRYSDVNFMLLQKVFEEKGRLSLDQYLKRHFYQPLNLRRTIFNPLVKFKVNEIAPTANDQFFRKQVLRGYVHDESAALNGGVGGNAGLFSTSRDLAVIGQLFLNKGSYGGKRYFEETTMDMFTKSNYGNHRGLAFDKVRKGAKNKLSNRVSKSSYGHTGFTGGVMWMDPKHNLVFIFNTNRIHPKVNNWQISKGKYRRKMQDVIYKALTKKADQTSKALIVNLED